MISIMLVDDHPVLRRGVIQLIDLEDDLQVVCEVNTGERAITEALKLEPELILLDLNMKGLNGIETLAALKQAGVTSKIIMYTVSDNEEDVTQAFRAGVDGYILKDTEPEDLIAQIYKAASGELVLSNPLAPILAKALRPSKSDGGLLNRLTNRERQIWRLISKGKSNKVIAQKLDITEATVKVHVKNLFKKIQLKSRIEAALFAVEHGFFTDR